MAIRSRLRTVLLVATACAALAVPHPSGAVVGGSPASSGEYPWAVAIYTGSPSGGQKCGGSLVSPRYVVTAAHCIDALLDNAIIGLPVDPFGLKLKVLAGRNRLNGPGGQQISVRRVIAHGSADAAMLELATPAAATPIRRASPAQAARFAPGAIATIAGWGATSEGGSGSNDLLEAEVPIVTDAKCANAYGSEYSAAWMLCAGYDQGGVDTCQGDSGGPLMVRDEAGSWLLAGITSFGEGCARAGYPGVYTEVAAVASFIDTYV